MNIKVLLLILFLPLFSLSKEKTQEQIEQEKKEYREKVFSIRLNREIDFMEDSLFNCSRAKKNLDISKLVTFSSNLKKTDGNLLEKLRLLKLINKYLETNCKISKSISEVKNNLSERKKFFVMEILANLGLSAVPFSSLAIRKIFSEFDPYCSADVIPSYEGRVENNSCHAADTIAAKSFWKNANEGWKYVSGFTNTMYDVVFSKEKYDTIDLWLEIGKPALESRDLTIEPIKFLEYLFLFNIAGPSSIGYFTSFFDHVWKTELYSKEGTAESVLENFSLLKAYIDWFFNIRTEVRFRKLKTKINGNLLKGYNRHDITAMYLSCKYKKYGRKISTFIPRILGTAYESLDFISHVKEDVGYVKSIQAFKKDVSRYVNSSGIGYEMCAD